ncbi:heme exporter protein CcmB [Martelella lutilitoris]|uniref:Heme exporter protein B n=1 Tax=Martelella lutilitoris TaxID=2583532 RepID=A0A7T7KL03_9HYPH|nr:heme exporter protein CcmB [Martelella lutilitoris]QQM30170.1 heme exporter protein CcmB [Martelella lutilitoris]
MGALYRRDVILALRAGGGALVGLLFFLCVVATVPFGVGPDLALLARIGPAIVWIAVLLSTLIGLDRLFRAERDDGSLDLLKMQDEPLVLIVLVKCLAHWTAYVLPLIILSPVMGLLMNVGPAGLGAAFITLLVGSPAITFIGAAGAAIAVSLPRGGLLVPILILPLAIPVLIFGVGASYAATSEIEAFLPPFLILVALTLFFAVVGPLAASLALRQGDD